MRYFSKMQLMFLFAFVVVIGMSLLPDLALSQGYFTDQSYRLPDLQNLAATADIGDVDGDGDLDVVVGTAWQNRDHIFINQGGGNFADETEIRMPVLAEQTMNTYLVDVDGDGDLDIVSGQANVKRPALFINLGGAQAGTPGVFSHG